MKTLELNGFKYSREQFDGYEYRIKIEIRTVETKHLFDIYTNDSSLVNIENVLLDRKSDDVTSLTLLSITTKKQDEETSKFLDEILK